jgi:hypothetical protein
MEKPDMDMKAKPSARIEPLPPEHTPDLKDAFAPASRGWSAGKHTR